MKNTIRLFGIIALVAVIGFSFVGCDELFGTIGNETEENGNGGSGNGGNGGGGGTNPTITIRNNTGYLIKYSGIGGAGDGGVWIKPSTSAQSWGSNLLNMASSIEDGASRTFTLSQPLSTQSVYDIRLRSQNFSGSGYNFIKSGITVTEGMVLTFTTSDLE